MIRNKAGQYITAQLNSKTNGDGVTTGTTTVTVIKDGGVSAPGAGTVVHIAGGTWQYMPTQSETDTENFTAVFYNELAVTQSRQVYTETVKQCVPIDITDCEVSVEEVRAYCNTNLPDSIIAKYIAMVDNKIGACLAASYDDVTASLITLNLVAHLTCGINGQKTSTRAPNGASVSFSIAQTKDGLRSSQYGQQAYDLDTKGCWQGLIADSFVFEVIGC